MSAISGEPHWRLECQPGEELQLDFGLGAPIDDGQGKKRRSWVLRMVLSYSRKAYSEAVTRQDSETFICCLENGLRNLSGSTTSLVARTTNCPSLRCKLGKTMSIQSCGVEIHEPRFWSIEKFDPAGDLLGKKLIQGKFAAIIPFHTFERSFADD